MRKYRRRSSNAADRFLDHMAHMFSSKMIFTLMLTAAGMVFIILIVSCYTAAVLDSSGESLRDAHDQMRYCQEYYDAESDAAGIISILAEDDGRSITDNNSELKYDTGTDEITISRNGGNFSFYVPFDSPEGKKNLHVIVKITGDHITPVQWCITD